MVFFRAFIYGVVLFTGLSIPIFNTPDAPFYEVIFTSFLVLGFVGGVSTLIAAVCAKVLLFLIKDLLECKQNA